jgi:pyridoxal phosphate enzyme (YggS family)
MSEIVRNLANVQERMANAALRAGREPSAVTLIAIAKTFPAEAIVAAYEAGVRHFGENRVKEGAAKISEVASAISGPRPRWHMVGHIQSRKAQAVVSHFDYVHSVSRLKIARRLSRFAEESGQTLPTLLQCNVSGEETKYGFDLQGWGNDAARRDTFLAAVDEILTLPGLAVRGLMTMAPFVDDPETVRPIFASLRGLLDVLRERYPEGDWRHLSMGMTDDFEIAIEEGATMVRVGRAIFGQR